MNLPKFFPLSVSIDAANVIQAELAHQIIHGPVFRVLVPGPEFITGISVDELSRSEITIPAGKKPPKQEEYAWD